MIFGTHPPTKFELTISHTDVKNEPKRPLPGYVKDLHNLEHHMQKNYWLKQIGFIVILCHRNGTDINHGTHFLKRILFVFIKDRTFMTNMSPQINRWYQMEYMRIFYFVYCFSFEASLTTPILTLLQKTSDFWQPCVLPSSKWNINSVTIFFNLPPSYSELNTHFDAIVFRNKYPS